MKVKAEVLKEKVRLLREESNMYLTDYTSKLLCEAADIIETYQKAFEDIRAEIQTKCDSIPWRNTQYDDGWIEGLEWVLEGVIDKHNPDKVGKESE